VSPDLEYPHGSTESTHPWLGIDLGVYETHMSDPRVGQLQLLHRITGQQLADHPARSLGVLGVAGGNGLDLVDPAITAAVYGYNINPDYLEACRAPFGHVLGDRLRLIETRIDHSVRIEPVDLLIANLVVEYIGLDEFVRFVAANAHSIGTLSCVVQHNVSASFVSVTAQTASFDGLASVASDISADELCAALAEAGFTSIWSADHPLPDGKSLQRRDFRSSSAILPG